MPEGDASWRLDPVSGWLEGVRRVPSPNCDERPPETDIDLVVVHGISLPPRVYGGQHIDRLFTNTLDPDAHPDFRPVAWLRVSAHVLI
ncbi:MAG: 1,6-anhydro-N-acetylmuramyl-L-alanine amidase AmpD, partial [Gammaproteobacteria bacterium]